MGKNRVLVSLYHKDDRVESLRRFNGKFGFIASSGTAKFLRDRGFEDVVSVEERYGVPYLAGGRVRTLCPEVFAGILYDRENREEREEIEKRDVDPICGVVVELYPFGEEGDSEELIDIGGEALVRAAAKKWKDVFVVVNWNGEELLNSVEDAEVRWELAKRAWEEVVKYNGRIAAGFGGSPFVALARDGRRLRYGENPYDEGWWFPSGVEVLLEKKELSYNNLLDLDYALKFVRSMGENSAVIIKHTNPTGAAAGGAPGELLARAVSADPVSAYGSVIAVNSEVDGPDLEPIKKLFVEVFAARNFTEAALKRLRKRKGIRVVKWEEERKTEFKLRSGSVGTLFSTEKEENFSHPDPDVEMAWNLVRWTASNGVVLVKDRTMLGAGFGETSRVFAAEIAFLKAKRAGFDVRGCVLASDGFIPFTDLVDLAGRHSVRAIVQPGGSKNDEEVMNACEKRGIEVVLTGFRGFRH